MIGWQYLDWGQSNIQTPNTDTTLVDWEVPCNCEFMIITSMNYSNTSPEYLEIRSNRYGTLSSGYGDYRNVRYQNVFWSTTAGDHIKVTGRWAASEPGGAWSVSVKYRPCS